MSVFALNAVRGSRLADGATAPNLISVSRRTSSVVFSLDVDPDGETRSYRVFLRDPAGRVTWQAALSAAGAAGTVGVTVPTAALRDGDYAFTLEGLSGQGRPLLSRTYRLHVTITK